jgi:hypothetical protein
MKPYAETIPEKDRKIILDLFHGRTTTKIMDAEEISNKLKGKYTPAQIISVIRWEIED